MKSIFTFLAVLMVMTLSAQNITITPASFNQTDEITITLSGIDVQQQWGTSDVYLWAWFYEPKSDAATNSPVTGSGGFGNSPAEAQFTNNGDGTYSYVISDPTQFYNSTNIDRIGVLAKSQNGASQTGDFIFNVGVFGLNLNNPTEAVSFIDAGNTLSIQAETGVTANYELFVNGTSTDTQNGLSTYTYDVVISEDSNFELVATNPDTNETLSETFQVLLTPNPTLAAVPAGMKDGINISEDNTSVTLVLYAPNKDYVHLIGNFNGTDWALSNDYLLNFDEAQDKHWITLNNQTPGENLLFQYLIDTEITIADPYSTLVLTPNNDVFIPESTFPNIPDYPSEKTQDAISWVIPGAPEYTWQIDNFEKPAKEDLVVYELLVRDFDDNKNFQDVIDRLDYLETLGINAIELMPVSEFDGNISWGYNPQFHMALDKAYGTPDKFKELVDEAHARGMAIILDVVYNQATGQNPLYRMYNNCNGCYGGQATAESPYFNQVAQHSYNVFNDFDHSSNATRQYVMQTAQYWIEEYKIDGMRWDLTKGFTQNCEGDEGCTNSYNQDRVDVLKLYADAQWDVDEDFLIIFEHLGNGGSRQEEIEWGNYRLDEGKGIMTWNKLTNPYNQSTMGYNTENNISGVSYINNNFTAPTQVSYMESHDEERLNYKNLAFGNSNASYDATDLPTALDRLEAAGAFFFTVPGPKMIWQFGELGYETSIFTCSNGTLPTPYGNDQCKLDEKPDGWDFLNDQNRVDLYNTWSQLIALKLAEPIFKTTTFTLDVGNANGLKKIQLEDTNATGNSIRYVTVLGNFGITTQSINPTFQETGTWYNMLTNETIEVTNTANEISLEPGQFYVYANEANSLSTQDVSQPSLLSVYPNPATQGFSVTQALDTLEVYDMNGRLILKQSNISTQDTIQTGNLSEGLYIVKATAKGNSFVTKLQIKK